MTITPARPDAPSSSADFASLGVPRKLIEVLYAQGITSPRPIQQATFVDAFAGRDVLGRAATGSGKTLAFALPLVASLARAANGQRRPRRPRSLVLVPTRELANQVADVAVPLARAVDLRVATVFGGVSQHRQVNALQAGVDVLVACPGRLEDLVRQGHCRLDGVEITVLDEADHMADLGFLPTVRRLLDLTPAKGQRLLFSATLDNGVDVLTRRYLDQPVTHVAEQPETNTEPMTHHLLTVAAADKHAVVRNLAAGQQRALLFTRTKHGAKKLAGQLTKDGIPAVELHGNLSQPARVRNLAAFSEGSVKVLVATDIAARGIHVDDIALVVHVDVPAEAKAFIHRSGRTARGDATGTVVTVLTSDQRRDVDRLVKAAGIQPRRTNVTPEHEVLLDLSGPHAERVEPSRYVAPAPSLAASSGGPRSRRSGSNGGSGGGPGRGRSGGGNRSNSGGAGGNRSGGPGAAGGARRRSRGGYSGRSA